jgi:hypothetical protein
LDSGSFQRSFFEQSHRRSAPDTTPERSAKKVELVLAGVSGGQFMASTSSQILFGNAANLPARALAPTVSDAE